MDTKSLNKTLRDEAISLGLCAKWQRMWKDGWDRQELISRYKEGIDFCIKNNFPSNSFIKKNVDRDQLRRNAFLVDDEWSLLNQRCVVMLGDSRSNIRYNGWNPGTVYIRHSSKANIVAKNMAFVIVHLFDEASIECNAEDKASIVVLRHSLNTNVISGTGSIRITNELNYLV